MRVAVLGSGADALAVAADMSCHGRDTTLADFDDSRSNLEPVAARGGIVVTQPGRNPGPHTYPVTVADDIPHATDGADLIAVVVPPSAHTRVAAAVAPHVTADQTVLFLGDGSGAIVGRRAIDPPTLVAEANTVPCLAARLTGPGEITTAATGPAAATLTGPGEIATAPETATPGPVLIAALPASPAGTAHVIDLISDVWPHATATDTVWSTVLSGYRAIARTVTTIATTGTLQDLTGMLWAEGATPEVAIVMETVDNELLALRRALNSSEPRRYQDFLVTQAPDPVQADDADITESVSCSLVLASSLGAATGVPTPVADGLVDVASVMVGRDVRAEGRTLATLGLDGLDTTGLIGFARAGFFP